jgi:hypothetical protein
MKKRANPLEKIMSKLMSNDNEGMKHKPPPTPAGTGRSLINMQTIQVEKLGAKEIESPSKSQLTKMTGTL